MTTSYFTRPSTALLQENPWIQAEIEARAYELSHTVDDPEFGRIIRFNSVAEIQEYQRLLDTARTVYDRWIEEISRTYPEETAAEAVPLETQPLS